ncbi:alpha/beta fold hydrolase [Sphingomonas sp.]|uniref:alpha/beta fold hydrolase n=1 Tax=Sphingomonas sp. TaxID=28214 RepID=UPI0035BBF153
MAITQTPIRARDGACSARLLEDDERDTDAPLLVCIHGGGCNARYFEMMRPSLADAALARGFAVLLVDRPGHGGNPAPASDQPVADSVAHIRDLVADVLAKHQPGTSNAALVGHSIGGAVALMLAADPRGLPWRAVAVSGIGDEPPAATRAWAAGATTGANPGETEPVADMFFGPPGTYDWRGPAALRRVAEPWNLAEVLEIVSRWPKRWPDVAAAIRLPVHLRLADHDGIWHTGLHVVERMAARLTASSLVDAALLPDGGHVYDIHRRGPELIAAQIDFVAGQIAGG